MARGARRTGRLLWCSAGPPPSFGWGPGGDSREACRTERLHFCSAGRQPAPSFGPGPSAGGRWQLQVAGGVPRQDITLETKQAAARHPAPAECPVARAARGRLAGPGHPCTIRVAFDTLRAATRHPTSAGGQVVARDSVPWYARHVADARPVLGAPRQILTRARQQRARQID